MERHYNIIKINFQQTNLQNRKSRVYGPTFSYPLQLGKEEHSNILVATGIFLCSVALIY
jgi:hypothetical protein